MPETASNGLTLVSLFSGCGGSSLGYKAAGYDVRLAVDNDPKAAACYRLNFPGTPFWEGDVALLGGAEALARVGEGELDVLDGSPPCQGFSTAGKRVFTDRRNRLFEEFTRLLLAFRPKAFIMENVGGLVKGKMKLAFAEMTLALKGAGYTVSCRLLNAWWYGVPQDRRRLIWVGVREGLGIAPSHPFPTHIQPLSVAEAFGLGAAAVETHPGYADAGWMAISPTLGASRKPLLARGLWNDIPGNKPRPLSLPSATLLASRPPTAKGLSGIEETHQPQVVEVWEASKPGQSLRKARRFVGSFQSVRLDPSRPSPTQIGAHRNWRWDEPRYLTVGEAKTLQGFPGSFQVSEYRLVGNSVPPPMAEAVGRHVAGLLKGGAG